MLPVINPQLMLLTGRPGLLGDEASPGALTGCSCRQDSTSPHKHAVPTHPREGVLTLE